MKKFGVLAAVLSLLVGCATTVPTPIQHVVTLSSGDKIEYVTVDAQDHSGVMSRVVDRYIKDPKSGQVMLITKDGFSGPGLGNAFMTGGFAGLAQAGGIMGGAALLRPSNTNMNNNNTGAGAGSTVGDGSSGGLNPGMTVNAVGNGGASNATGGSAVSISGAAANASSIQNQVQGQGQFQINKGNGWIPPGQRKK